MRSRRKVELLQLEISVKHIFIIKNVERMWIVFKIDLYLLCVTQKMEFCL